MLIWGKTKLINGELIKGLTYIFNYVAIGWYLLQCNVLVLVVLQKIMKTLKSGFPTVDDIVL